MQGVKKWKKNYRTSKNCRTIPKDTCTCNRSIRRRKRKEKNLKKQRPRIFPKLMTDTRPQTQKAQRTSSRINTRMSKPKARSSQAAESQTRRSFQRRKGNHTSSTEEPSRESQWTPDRNHARRKKQKWNVSSGERKNQNTNPELCAQQKYLSKMREK